MGKGHWYAIRVIGFDAQPCRGKCPDTEGQSPQLLDDAICYSQGDSKRR